MKKQTKAQTMGRFWAKVNKAPGQGPRGDCWQWTASKIRRGYGQFCESTFTGKYKNWKAHRFSWFLAHGPIPDDKLILHSCDNPSCCNPAHLFAGTQKDNIDDMFSKGREKWMTGVIAAIKIPLALAQQIKAEYEMLPMSNGGIRKQKGPVAELARKYGMSCNRICGIGKRTRSIDSNHSIAIVERARTVS